MINKEIGGGGITSLRQVLVNADKSNTVKDGEFTITYSADSEYYRHDDPVFNFMGISYGANYHYDTNEYNLETMWCSGFDFPHWWQVDLGRTIYGVCKFIFNPIEEMYVYVKDYELSYSLDGLNFTKIYSGTYIPDHKIGITSHGYKILQDEECEFTPVNLRYFRITILNNYEKYPEIGYAEFNNARLYCNNEFLCLDKNNYIHGCKNNI